MIATSTVATLTVYVPQSPIPSAPVIINPTQATILETSLGSDNVLVVGAAAWPPPSYQWRFKGVDLPGATNATLILFDINDGKSGTYSVVVSNANGTATSPPITVKGNSFAPSFGGGPLPVSAVEGSIATLLFQNLNEGAPPATFSLFRNGARVGLPLNASSQLILRDVSMADVGDYFFISSNRLGNATSLVATVTVTPSQPLDRWTQRNPLPQSDRLLGVAYGSGRFVAVGSRGAVTLSTNGIDWSLHRLKAEVELSGIAFGNGVYNECNYGLLRQNTFVDVVVQAKEDGTMFVSYGSDILFSNVFAYLPTQGRFGFGAATGGSHDNHWIDDLTITTKPLSAPYVQAASPTGPILDQMRKRYRSRTANALNPADTSVDAEISLASEESITPNALWDEEWKTHLLAAAMARVRGQVRAEHFQIFEQTTVHGWSIADTAKAFNVSRINVHVIRHRISGLMRKELKRLEGKLV